MNPDPIRVLVSGAGGDAGQGVIKALQQSTMNFETYATCIRAESPWLYRVERGFIAPPSASSEYVPFIISLIKSFEIDLYIPTVDSEILKIAQQRERIQSESGSRVFVGKSSAVAIAADKLATANFLQNSGLPHPETALASDEEHVADLFQKHGKLILKPRAGHGSQGVQQLNVSDELEFEWRTEQYVVQEWLDPSQGEFTSGIYLGRDGEVKGACTFLRELRHGSTHIATRIINSSLENPLIDIAVGLGLPYLNIQSMRREDTLIPFEFNARLSGSTAIVSKVFNPVEMYVREWIGQEQIEVSRNVEQFVAMRYLEEEIVSLAEIEMMRAQKIEQ
jgi:carbamoyl-phosphate synthase large subunit